MNMEETNNAIIDQIDANSLVHVLSFLSIKDKQNSAQVCKYWKDLASLPCLWKSVTVVVPHSPSYWFIASMRRRKITRFVCRGSTLDELELVINNIPDITSLKIDQSRHINEEFLRRNVIHLDKLAHLNITNCSQVDLQSLYYEESLGKVLGRLKSLTLPKNINAASFQALIKKCPCLEELEFDKDYGFSGNDQCQKVLVQSCPNLRFLDLGYSMWFSEESWKLTLEALNLKAIKVNSCNDIDTDHIKMIADLCPNLESLDMSSHSMYSNDIVNYVAKKLKHLKHFSFSTACLFVSEFESGTGESKYKGEHDVLHEVSEMTKLESLNIRLNAGMVTGETLCSLVENMSKLRTLNIRRLGKVSAIHARLIGKHLPELNSLKVVISWDCGPGSSGIGLLCAKLPNLTDLHIISSKLSNEDLNEMSSGVVPSKLKSLKIDCSRYVTDLGISYVSNGLTSLTNLDISSCNIGDPGISSISEHLLHLEVLILNENKRVSNHGALTIGKHLKCLEDLRINGTGIGDQGFAFICNHLPRLHTLEALCPLITDVGYLE
ncbi:F-box/LRR-repeat protein 7, partial [Exaiptasia diaphana]